MTKIQFLRQGQTGGSGLPPTTPARLGQLILNTIRPAMALQIVNDAPSPSISTAVFGPSLITNGLVFPAPRDTSIKSSEFMFSTSRSIGPGLFFQEPGKTSPTPSSDILAGSFQQNSNKILLIGPDSNPQTFATPSSSLVGDTLSLGANSGAAGKRTISVGSSAQANPTVAGALPVDMNISIGYNSMSGLFSQAQTGEYSYPNSSNVALGAEAMGMSSPPPKYKSAASEATVVGYKSGLGLLGKVKSGASGAKAQFTVVGAKSFWASSDGPPNSDNGVWGTSVFLGSGSYQVEFASTTTGFSISNSVCIGNNVGNSTPDSKNFLYNSTLIGPAPTKIDNVGVTWNTINCTSIAATPNQMAYLDSAGGAFALANYAVIKSGTTEFTSFYRPGNREYQFFEIQARTSAGNPDGWSTSWESPLGSRGSFGPYVSNGTSKQFVFGDAVSASGYTAASGSFKDDSGKIYTVKNGLITSIA